DPDRRACGRDIKDPDVSKIEHGALPVADGEHRQGCGDGNAWLCAVTQLLEVLGEAVRDEIEPNGVAGQWPSGAGSNPLCGLQSKNGAHVRGRARSVPGGDAN